MRSVSGTHREYVSARRPKILFEILDYRGDANILHFASRAPNHLYSIVGNLLSHIDTKGYAHQVSVFEFHSGAFVAIIQEDVVAS